MSEKPTAATAPPWGWGEQIDEHPEPVRSEPKSERAEELRAA